MTDFIGGLALSRRFYQEAARPILDDAFPGLHHSAALIGSGSEVLGYDTSRSVDHEWGPRVLIFLAEADLPISGDRVRDTLAHRLPPRFLGYSTHFDESADEAGTLVQAEPASGPVTHKVDIVSLDGFARNRFGLDVHAEPEIADWLSLPEQKLLELTAGAVFHDGLGTLEPLRARYAYYPRDVWLYRLAAQWQRISQYEHIVGRAGEVGDEIGSALIGATLVRDLMRLCFLMERRYAPYPKWFGTAFARLACASVLTPILTNAVHVTSWQEREAHLVHAYEHVAAMHNTLGITPLLDPTVRPFFTRPFQVLFAERFADAILTTISDPAVRAVAGRYGAVDQLADSTDVLSNPSAYRALAALYK